MRILAGGLVALTVAVSGCGDGSPPAGATLVTHSGLDELLLSNEQIDATMGAAMTPLATVTHMSDNRHILPNLNCLGVWQAGEAAVYGERGPDGWQAMRQQTLRSPDSEAWESVAVQSVISYPSVRAAQEFLGVSTTRWAECTEHQVNITLNDRRLPTWSSGALEVTDGRLSMPITRVGDGYLRNCQHVLAVSFNVIIDVQACKAQTTAVNQAAEITRLIQSAVADQVDDASQR